jgi:hypothetical protein
MRHPITLFLIGIGVATAAACADSASRLAAPDNSASALSPSSAASFSQGSDNDSKDSKESKDDKDKITICHAAGRAGTTKYVEITVSRSASYAHLDEHGTPRAGHEEDFIEPEGQHGCSSKSGATVTKRLVRVFIMSGNQMIDDPTWTVGQPVNIPVGETRWVRYEVTYTLPSGVTGTITENPNAVCATVSAGMHCGFNTGGVFSWSVSGSGKILVDIDLSNDRGCGAGSFTNTAVLTPSVGKPISAVAPATINLICPAFKKTLDRVFIMSGNQMIDDPNWSRGQTVSIPHGQTRWLRYVVSYVLPSGVTGTVTENHNAVCSTVSPGVGCGFNTAGVFSWAASGTGTVLVDIDLANNTGCGNGNFTNTAVLTLANGATVSASAPTKLSLGCK